MPTKRDARFPTPFPTDEESIDARRRRAHAERAQVQPLQPFGEFYGNYAVSSTERNTPYCVEIRALNQNLNACGCLDYMTNRLGTCKHIERVLQVLCEGHMLEYAEAAAAGSPLYEIFVDMQADIPGVRLLVPEEETHSLSSALLPFFDANRRLVGNALVKAPELRQTVQALDVEQRARVRVTGALDEWLAVQKNRERRTMARRDWMADVSQGKRKRNPLLKPLPPYQIEGMLHLAFGERAMLADEMGLGKTVQAIAACELLRDYSAVAKVLIVTPESRKSEWARQIATLAGQESISLSGSKANRQRTYRDTHFYVIANYEQVRADTDDMNTLLSPDIVILDQAQRIKNWLTRTAKAVKQLRSAYAFVLSGAPLGNRIEDIYSLVEFLDPHVFGALFRFQREFFSLDHAGKVLPRNLAELHRRVNSVMLRRRKADVLEELPPRSENTFVVPMDPEQRKRYSDCELRVQQALGTGDPLPNSPDVLAQIQQDLSAMRMLCDTPYILGAEQRACPKCDELLVILDELLRSADNRILIFTEWERMLTVVGDALHDISDTFVMLTSDLKATERDVALRQFNEDPARRILMCTDAAGKGLKVKAANVVIHLDQPWSPTGREQRLARVCPGNQKQSVSVIHLLSANSIETSIHMRMARKPKLADAILDGEISEFNLVTTAEISSFIAQARELLPNCGPENAPDATSGPGRGMRSALKNELVARLCECAPEGILRVESSPDVSALLVVITEGGPAKLIRNSCAALFPKARVQIISESAYASILELMGEGILHFSMDFERLYCHPSVIQR